MSKKDTDPKGSDIDAPADGEAAEVAEAAGVETIEVEWNDRAWTVPASYGLVDAVAFRGIRRIGQSQVAGSVTLDDAAEVVDVLEALLGRGQFRAWSAGGRSSVGDAFDLVNEIVGAWGTSPGE